MNILQLMMETFNSMMITSHFLVQQGHPFVAVFVLWFGVICFGFIQIIEPIVDEIVLYPN